ncbi:MAG: sugar kinase [Pseudolysinimonas sp.]|uniref:sugar kinase n=1 Tax=Pseudolysinimonas sp. TaxID=2680009 RepID=UPI003C711FA4
MTGAVVTLGETMGLLRATSIGSLEHVSDFALHIGGAESNVAIGVARLGRPAVWIGRVGDDGIGRRVLRELRAEGVTVDAVVDPSARTGLMLKETPRSGSTRVLYYRAASAGSRLDVADVDLVAIAPAGVLHVTGITLALSASAEAAVFAAVDAAAAAGVPVSFDVNHRAALWADRDPRDLYRRVAERATVVFAGADEAELLVGAGSPEELAAGIADLGPAQAIVKLGEDGCVASIDGEAFSIPAEKITPLDTVGAGDAFVAGYLVALLDGLAPADRLQQGTRCGAFACLGPGDWESLPRRADLDAFDSGDPVIR